MSSTSERLAKLSPQKLALLQKKMSESAGIAEPIAVVGMGCRFAGVANIADFWRTVRSCEDHASEIPASRWNVDEFFDSSGATPGKMTTRWGAFIENIDHFDAMFFGISPREAEKMDPQHRLLLQVTWEALEYGGIAPSQLRESATGVFVGVGGVDYSRIPVQLANYYETITAYSGTGNALSIAANRISYSLDLRGPSLAIDTACSSSLVAAHLAIRSLRGKECETAIVGGVNAILTPETTLAFSQAQMLSPEGKCRPFDHRANGYVRGEGCGVIILKRLSDAVRDKDLVLAVIRGSAINQDGLTSGITAPRGKAQVGVILQALKDARCTPDDISYIEAHGTATPLGDPIEVNALAEVFRSRSGSNPQPCFFGSVKANVGHTETAAGMASLIKTILMLGRREIPPQTHFERLNPHIDLAGSRLQVAQELMAWEAGEKNLIAGISGFGFGGSNAHVILEAATTNPVETPSQTRPQHLLTLSAKSPERLQVLAQSFQQTLTEQADEALPDTCFTAAVGRSHFKHRLAVSGHNAAELSEGLAAFCSGARNTRLTAGKSRSDRRFQVAFLFPGQGSQFPGMGRALYQSHPVFRSAIDQCDTILAALLPQRLSDVLFADPSEQPLVHQTQYTQPALFAVEYALSQLWRSYGVEPAVMIGHSIGDYVAACEAGVFSLADGLTLIAHRGRLVQSLPRDGMMAAIFATREQVEDLVVPYSDDVGVAVHNGPENVVIAGRTEVVRELLDQCERAGMKSKALEVSHAMHSPLLEPILDEFEQLAAKIEFSLPKLPLISSRDGETLDGRVCHASYWRDHLRNTVNFVSGIGTLQSYPLDAAIEVGPGSTLCGLASRIWDNSKMLWLPSIRNGRDEWETLLKTLSDLYVNGAAIDWQGYDRPWPRRRRVLPTYPFEPQKHWYDMSQRQSKSIVASSSGETLHPLLGRRLPVAGEKIVFELVVDRRNPTFLADHCVDQNPVFPAAGYMEQALAAARVVFGEGQHRLTDLSIQQAMILAGDHRRVVQVQLGPDQRGERSFEVHSRPLNSDDEAKVTWTLHAYGTIREGSSAATAQPPVAIDGLCQDSQTSIDQETFYARMANCGLQYGPRFQILTHLQAQPSESGKPNEVGKLSEALAQLDLDSAIQHEPRGYLLHPAILDGCLQSMAGVVGGLDDAHSNDLMLPTFARNVRVLESVREGKLWVHARLVAADSSTDSFAADLTLLGEDGRVIAEIEAARVQRVAKQRTSRDGQRNENKQYEVRWEPLPSATAEQATNATNNGPSIANQRWVIFAGPEERTNPLADALVAAKGHVSLVTPGDSFRKCNSASDSPLHRYQLRANELADYEALLKALAEEGATQIHVIDLRALITQGGGQVDLGQGAIDLCTQALMLLRGLGKSTAIKPLQTWLVTQNANAVDATDNVDPAQTALWGMGRSAIVEMPHVPCRLVDLDGSETPQIAAEELVRIITEAAGQEAAREDHLAVRDGRRLIARLQPLTTTNESGTAANKTQPPTGRFSLRVGRSTSLDALHYEAIGAGTLQPNDVEIEVKATGLNFSDVLKALGLYPGMKDAVVPLGIECAGVVSRVGADVTRFVPGQRVMGVAPYSFASHAVTAEYAIVATPNSVSDEQAATIPITFLTAYHAVCSMARLTAGEKILIHAGAGGVGQAAIQIAKQIGAEIFVTAGSEEKRQFLRSLGIQHVMDSRSLSFADQVLEITGGTGVDVVLNSLPGEAITKSLSILSAYGRFLEIGKTDIYQNRRIGLWPFQDNLSYFAIDLDRMLRQRPQEIRRLYDEVMPHFEAGSYQPLPLTSFAADEVIDAYRYMAQRKNIGKVVVSMVAPNGNNAGSSNSDQAAHEQQGTLLITGGLGALGQQVAQWGVGQGIRHLAILTRRSAEEVRQQSALLETNDVQLAVLQGDVSDRASLATALESLPPNFPPIRKVVHAAGVLSDGLMQTMDPSQLRRAMAPKSLGAWNLHQSLGDQLDTFVMFSSVAGTMGSPGQGNYAAGNAFLDGLAALRRRQGRPALSIAWGPWGASGMAASDEIKRQLGERGMTPLIPEEAMQLFDQAVKGSRSQLMVADVDWKTLISKLPGGGSSLLTNFRSQTATAGNSDHRQSRDEQLYARLIALGSEERLAAIEQVIATALGEVMGVAANAIEVDQPLAALGLDSLMAMELRSTLETKLGIEIPVAALFDNPSVSSLAKVSAQSFANVSEPSTDGGEALAAPTSGNATSGNGARIVSAEPLRRADLVGLGGGPGGALPLFCIHPVGGDLRCYDGFARAMRSRWVYGLRAHGLQLGSEPHASMEAMVDDYIKTIRSAQGDGPYCLMGWSTGGIFAYEIARRLDAEGSAIQSLVMVDTPLPNVFEKIDLRDNAKFLYDLVEFANYFAGTSMVVDYEMLRGRSEQESIASVLDQAIVHGVLPAQTTPAYLQRLIGVCKQHVRILQAYQPPQSNLMAHLLRPEDTSILSEAARQNHAEDFGWSEFVQLRLQWVSGHHFTMMTGDNARSIAAKIDRLLDHTTPGDVRIVSSSTPTSTERQSSGMRQ